MQLSFLLKKSRKIQIIFIIFHKPTFFLVPKCFLRNFYIRYLVKVKVLFIKEVIKIESSEVEDVQWSQDWKAIVDIFDTIDRLETLFKTLDVSYLREVQQKILILNLQKYAWSLQNYIVEKYSNE